MTESTSAEPSLDEILASIRRIIAEEGPAAAAASASPGMRYMNAVEADDVLVLTRRAPTEWHDMNDRDHHVAPSKGEPASDIAMDPAQAPALEAIAAPTAPRTIDAGQSASASPEGAGPPREEPVMAPETEAKTTAAFDKLSAVTRDRNAPPALMMPAPGRTIEDVVRELMRPMIKEWLDENLPAIVQDRVDQEIDRIARQRVR